MLDLVIRRGLVVMSKDAVVGDVGIQEGKIVAVASPGSLPDDGARVIQAEGKIVLPGGIEPHAHIAIPCPEYWAGRPEVMSQPPEAASRAAAFGGVTTVIDFAGDLLLTPGAKPAQRSMLESFDDSAVRHRPTSPCRPRRRSG
jgi:dihydroorotase-like cyclic amidohydrolase